MPNPLEEMIAAAQGGAPAAPPAPDGGAVMPAQGVDPRAAARAAEETPTPETAQEKASSALAPETEDKSSQQEAVTFDVPFDGKTRKLTPAQIEATFKRYADLNHSHAQMAPILDVLRPLLEGGADSSKVAGLLVESLKSVAEKPLTSKDTNPNPQPGQVNPDDFKYMQMQPEEWESELGKWETENAAAVPPGYKEAAKIINMMSSKIDELSNKLDQLTAGQTGQLDAAKAVTQDAKTQRVEAIRNTIATNLDAVQAEFQLPDEKAQEFMQFAQQRGYTMEDFVNRDFLRLVAKDFVNATAAPEAERLKQIAERRNAISGTLGPTPGAGGAAPAPGPAGGNPLDQLAQMAQGRRQANLL